MNIDKIMVGDVIAFRCGESEDSAILHGKVTAKGRRFPIFGFTDILYITVIEHPEWKNIVIEPKQVVEIICLPERVQFT